jgi:hypothetical protein
MVKIDAGTALVCEMVLGRYLQVLAENPGRTPPDYPQMFVEAERDLRLARQARLADFEHELAAIPTDTPDASLLRALTCRCRS